MLRWHEVDPGEEVGQYWAAVDHDARQSEVSGLPLPEAIEPSLIDGSGSLWMVVEAAEAGDEGSADSGLSEARIWMSADCGRAWEQVAISDPATTPHVKENLFGIEDVLVSGERVVVVETLQRSIDWSSLLADRGLIVEGREAGCTPLLIDDVLLCQERDADAVVDSEMTMAEWMMMPGRTFEVALEELDLSEDQLSALSPLFHAQGGEDWIPEHFLTMRVYFGDHRGLESGIDIPLNGRLFAGIAPDGTVLVLEHSEAGTTLGRLHDREAETLETVAVFERLHLGRRAVASGPAGLAAAATRTRTEADGTSRAEHWVGWSAEGADWEWQTATEAYGIDAEPLLAVGSDFVLAAVEDSSQLAAQIEELHQQAAEADSPEEAGLIAGEINALAFKQGEVRWFAAAVP